MSALGAKYGGLTLEDLLTRNLDNVEQLLGLGYVTTAQVEEYLLRWNATPGRFTEAYITGPSMTRIAQRVKP